MAQQHYKTPFKKALLQFITEPDPYLAMLKWVMAEMMRIEAEAKVGAAKGEHSKDRTMHFSGGRAPRVDTQMGTVHLDSQVADFQGWPLAEEYPFLWIDAMYQKGRVEGRVVSVAVMIACGVNPAGSREILAVEPMFDESEDSWRVFFRKLKARGMKRTELCISDAHAGIQAAVRKE